MPTQNEGGRYLDLRRDVRDLFERFNSGGRVRLRYRTKVYVGRAG